MVPGPGLLRTKVRVQFEVRTNMVESARCPEPEGGKTI